MTIQFVLDLLESARGLFERWGITAETLLVIGLAASVLFFVSLREVASWFLRIHQLREEVRAVEARLAVSERLLHEISGKLNDRLPEAAVTVAAEEPASKTTPAGSRFRLDH